MVLSVVLATYNEEENIEKCLDSVKGWAHEIVVVDGTSQDRTVEIARSYGARVQVRENPKIFHINKQIAIDMAKGDWILQLDADEVVPPGLQKEISEAIQEKSEINGYWMPRKNYFLGRFLMKGGQYPDYTMRLYRRGKGRLPQRDVHEQAEIEGEVGYLKTALLHYPYKDFNAYLYKWNKYTSIIAHQVKDDLKKKNIFKKVFFGFSYLFLRPVYWFLLTYFRHKGFYDGWQGFVFSFFSALRYPVSYVKYIVS